MNLKHYQYLIIFHKEIIDEEYSPIIYFEKGNYPFDEQTHLLDPDMNCTLEIMEFILQLPRGDFDLIDLHEDVIKKITELHHKIMVIPDYLLSNQYKELLKRADCIFLTPNVSDDIINRLPLFGVHKQENISKELLNRIWKQASNTLLKTNLELIKYNPVYVKGKELKILPLLHYIRQCNENLEEFLKRIDSYSDSDIEMIVNGNVFKFSSLINTYTTFANQYNTESPDFIDIYKNNFKSVFLAVQQTTHINVVITLPGLPRKIRDICKITSNISEYEQRAIRIMGLHRAIATNSAFIELNANTDKLYQIIDDLERKIKSGTNSPHIWKLLKKLGKELNNILTPEQNALILQAPSIDIFSECPIGLAIMPEFETPLSITHNIQYKPLTPLSRQLPLEINGTHPILLYKTCRILFIECVPNNEANSIVYESSEKMSSMIEEMSSKCKVSKYYHEKADTLEELKSVLNKYPTGSIDILIMSAHGFYDTKSNISGLCIGEKDKWMAIEDDIHVPPIVLLSACHVSPRGRTAVNACDLLMRSGAQAIISTHIPVNVYRNTILYTRLFTYIFSSINKEDIVQPKTLSDAWRHTMATNAVNEILEASSKLQEWFTSKNKEGIPRLQDFMLNRSPGRLKNTNIYSETINILKEMLLEDELNTNGEYDSILMAEKCFPESFFYQIVGYPEHIYLSDEIEKSI